MKNQNVDTPDRFDKFKEGALEWAILIMPAGMFLLIVKGAEYL